MNQLNTTLAASFIRVQYPQKCAFLGGSNDAYEFIIAARQPHPVSFWLKNSTDLFNTNQATLWLDPTWQLVKVKSQTRILFREKATDNIPLATIKGNFQMIAN